MGWFTGNFSREVPVHRETPFRIQVNGPCKVQGYQGDMARMRGVGSAVEREGLWVLQGPTKVEAPQWAWVRMEAFDGPLKVVGLPEGRMEVQKGHGPLKAQEVRAVHIQGVSGPVVLEAVTESATLENIRGPVKVNPCPGALEAQVTGPVKVYCPEPVGRRLTLRVRGPVAVQVPAEAQLHGRIQAEGGVHVEGIHQQPAAQSPTEVRWEAADPETALQLDIVAQGPKARVSIGPAPAAMDADVADMTDLGLGFARTMTALFGRLFGGGGKTARTKTATPPARSRGSESMDEARQRILHMLAQGKITAEEAERLLQALE